MLFKHPHRNAVAIILFFYSTTPVLGQKQSIGIRQQTFWEAWGVPNCANPFLVEAFNRSNCVPAFAVNECICLNRQAIVTYVQANIKTVCSDAELKSARGLSISECQGLRYTTSTASSQTTSANSSYATSYATTSQITTPSTSFQTTSQLLKPTSQPQEQLPTPEPTSPIPLSTASKAGIGIGSIIGTWVLLSILCYIAVLLRRKRHELIKETIASPQTPDDGLSVFEIQSCEQVAELDGVGNQHELFGNSPRDDGWKDDWTKVGEV